MERYENYRESGVEWLGEIPSHWKTVRISALYDSRNEKASADDYTPLSVTMQGIVPQLDTAAKSQDIDNRKFVRDGDFVINSRSDRRGSCGIAHQDGTVSLISNVLAPKDQEGFLPEYYGLLLKSEGFADEYYRWGTGIVDDLWSTNWSRMKNILVAAPPIEEQKAIAEYITSRASAIDMLIEETEKSIELLEEYRKSVISEAVTKGLDPDAPMKDSGIEWIGEIPAHWEMKKFKYIASVRANLVDPRNFSDLKQVSPERIEKDTGKLLECKSVLEAGVESDNHLFKKGQLLYSKVRPALNKVTIAPFDGLCSADMYPIETSEWTQWLLYAMLSQPFVVQVRVSTDRVKMPKVNKEELGAFWIPVPPAKEQIKIAEFLTAALASVETTIYNKTQLISSLQEYRKSLISEAVSGKIKVPEVN